MNQVAFADPVPSADAAKVLRYRVKGMDCPSCAGKIETAVSRLPGAENVRVNYHGQFLDLALNEAATSRTILARFIHQGLAGDVF